MASTLSRSKGYRAYRPITKSSFKYEDANERYYMKVQVEAVVKAVKIYRSELRFSSIYSLDIGCGIGKAEHFLTSRFGRIVGVGISKDELTVAQSRDLHNCEYICVDALELPFKSDSFDIVTNFSLFHHFDFREQVKVLRNVRKIMKKHGLVIMFDYNPYNLVAQYTINTEIEEEGSVLLSKRQMENAYNEAGLTVLESKYVIFAPKRLSFLDKVGESVAGRIPIGGKFMVVGQK